MTIENSLALATNSSIPFAAILFTAAIWEVVWKGLALWRAAQDRQTAWFIAVLIVNSLGILPIIYLLLHRRPVTAVTESSAAPPPPQSTPPPDRSST